MKISIIIVNYRVKDKLFECLKSVYQSRPKNEFEVIVVDNDQEESIKIDLLKKFPKVRYIQSSKNIGYGGGNNLGAKYAKGKYLFFLNPDTLVFKDTVDELVEFLAKNKNAGIVSPLILDPDRKPLDRQGYKELNLINGIFTFSFLRKKFPQFTVSSYYSLEDWKHIPIRKVETIYGAALMTPIKLFRELGGFDENFFLYFEENDLSRRVKGKDYELYIDSNSKIIHHVGQSTKQTRNRDEYFARSRFLYFKKYYGILSALFLETFLKINKITLFLLLAFLLAIGLRIYNLSNSMVFIGDQGWFYLSARDLLINGKIPLVGITSSHIWLHQGPLWTYMLSIALFVSKFNPVSGAYLTAAFGVLTTFLMYKLGREMFSQKVGMIAALLYATSPLIIFFDRMPFDPAPIPFFTIIYFYALYKWVRGSVKYFPVILLSLAVLYNLELATFTLAFPFVLIFVYGCLKKKNWVKELLNKKIVFFSLILPILVMLPVIIYDFSNGFKQTVVFVGWTLYKPLISLLMHSASSCHASSGVVINFLSTNLGKLVFQPNEILALSLFILAILYSGYVHLKDRRLAQGLLLFLLLVSLAGIIVNQTPSDAYLPIVFPFVIFTIAILFAYLLRIEILKYVTVLALALILSLNFYAAFQNDLKVDFRSRINAVDKIIKLANNQEYNLVGKGAGSQFRSFTMNYEYLLWWKGHPVSSGIVQTKIVVLESPKGIIISKND